MLTEFAHVRNMLLKNTFGSEEHEILLLAQKKVLDSKGPFSALITLCIRNCLEDVKANNFELAANELDFVHNLPINFSELQTWDEDYFYKAEFPSYIDNSKNLLRIKEHLAQIVEAEKFISKIKK